jgi:hypothetical protein
MFCLHMSRLLETLLAYLTSPPFSFIYSNTHVFTHLHSHSHTYPCVAFPRSANRPPVAVRPWPRSDSPDARAANPARPPLGAKECMWDGDQYVMRKDEHQKMAGTSTARWGTHHISGKKTEKKANSDHFTN